MRPLLYSPSGQVVAVEADESDRKDAILLELFALLAGLPTCVERWKAMGGLKVATSQMIGAIVEVLGKERIEQAWGIQLESSPAPAPKTFADVERQAAGMAGPIE